MTDAEQYISITGLKLSRVWHAPVFWTYAARCMDQARRAPGNVLADARSFDGIHHTLSVWSNRQAMLDYLVAGPHLQAMRLFPRIANGRTWGYASDHVPDWDEARAIWTAYSVEVRGR